MPKEKDDSKQEFIIIILAELKYKMGMKAYDNYLNSCRDFTYDCIVNMSTSLKNELWR